MGFGGLWSCVNSLDSLGLDVTRLRVHLRRKLAFASLRLGIRLIAIPRRGSD